MSTKSNLYAEKVFAEHPIALWSLDEDVDYISLISEADRIIAPPMWTITNGIHTVPNSSNDPALPFPNSRVEEITAYQPALVNEMLVENSGNGAGFLVSQMDQSLETFSIGTYVYSDSPNLLGYEIGYYYIEPSTGNKKRFSKPFSSSISNQWLYISETFLIPNTSERLRVFIKFLYGKNAGGPNPKFWINGLSVGQYAEQYSVSSLGVSKDTDIIDISTEVEATSMPGTIFGIVANAYGNDTSPGYYMTDKKTLFAQNGGVPMVYGSSGVTKINPNPNGPSMIVPGKGFLNESGRFQEYTIEAWVRLSVSDNKLHRIIGPVDSDDGIYVNGPFITLKIGKSYASHFIGEWFRPILLDLKLGINYANLIVNGEQVISIQFDTASIAMTPITSDWLGVYSYEGIDLFEIDTLGIYPYQVPSILLKRRFGFGQAVESPEGTNRAYGGVVAAIDYKFADYTNNYSYPLTGRWNQGILENISSDNDILSAPKYSNPEVVLQGSMTVDQWVAAQNIAPNNTNSYFKFGQSTSNGYFYIDSFNLLFQSISGIYGIFKVPALNQNNEKVLIHIDNPIKNSYFTMSLVGGSIQYKFSSWGTTRNLYYRNGILANTMFFAGIDVEDLSSFFGEDIQEFFANKQQLKIYIANNPSMTKQFDGEIHKVGICSHRNKLKIADLFDNIEIEVADFYADGGAPSTETWDYVIDGGSPESFTSDQLLSHIASYTIIAKSNFGKTYIDIETDSYWEDYIPLTYFAQYVDNIFGVKYYDLDFIQFNIDYPAFKKYDAASYDTSDQLVKSYISFQYVSSGANASPEFFTSVQPMPKNGVVLPGDNWMNTKYEVVNGAIIYPPKDISIESLAIVTHLELSVSGIKTNPVSIKKLEYASEAFNDFTANPVGTKYGVALYPYSQYASSFDYKSQNPFRIYKGSTPHLYLTSDSGINRVGDYSSVVPRGISMPVNASSAEQYRIIAMQMFLLYNKDVFSSQAIQLFEVAGTDKYLRFYIKANDKSGKRGRIYAVNAKTGTTEDGIAFYINGQLVRDPVISINEWVSLGISFATTFSFDEYPGAIRLTDTVLFNNISFYESSNLQEIQRQSKRSWSRVYTQYEKWQNLLRAASVGNFLWNDVLVTSSVSFFGINPGDIYRAYIGVNKEIANGVEPVVFGDAEIRVFTNVEWSSNIITPV